MNQSQYDALIASLNLQWVKCEDVVAWKSSSGGRPGKRINTPDGVFASLTEAAKFYGVFPSAISKRLDTYPSEYYRIEQDDEENELFDLERKVAHPQPTIIDLKRLRKNKRDK